MATPVVAGTASLAVGGGRDGRIRLPRPRRAVRRDRRSGTDRESDRSRFASLTGRCLRGAWRHALETLGETLSSGQAEDVAEYLLEGYASTLTDASERAGDAESDTDVEPDDAEQFAEAVTDAVAAALTEGEVRDLKSQLTGDLHPLFEDVTVDPEQL